MSPTWVVACGGLILLLGFGIRAGFGLFLQPMSLEFGWGREVFSFAMALGAAAALINLPVNEKPLVERRIAAPA